MAMISVLREKINHELLDEELAVAFPQYEFSINFNIKAGEVKLYHQGDFVNEDIDAIRAAVAAHDANGLSADQRARIELRLPRLMTLDLADVDEWADAQDINGFKRAVTRAVVALRILNLGE